MSQYIDTSLLAAFYCPEPLSDIAEQLITSMDSPVISALTEVELYSAVARKKRMKEINSDNSNEHGNAAEKYKVGAVAVGAGALGAIALGSAAFGAMAIGALALGRLMIRKAYIKELRVGTLIVDDLRVRNSKDGPAM